MENKAAKEFWKQPIQEKGSFTPESKTATTPSLVTTSELTTLSAKYSGTLLQFIDTSNNNNNNQLVVFEDTFVRKQGYTGRAPDGTFLRRCQQKLGNGLNVWYLYRTTPVLDDQTPSFILPANELAATAAAAAVVKEVNDVKQEELKIIVGVDTADAPAADATESTATDATAAAAGAPSAVLTQDNDDDAIVNLYMFARIIPVRGAGGTASYVVYSTIKGIDADCRESGAGFLWKDVYKVIKIPQFQYAALILDVSEYSNKIVGKSQQTSALDVRPTFTLAAGVDIPAVIASCVPLLPDGSKVWLGASLASEFSGMLASAK